MTDNKKKKKKTQWVWDLVEAVHALNYVDYNLNPSFHIFVEEK